MADESVLSLILKIKKAGSAKDTQSEIEGVEKAVRRAALGLTSFKGANEDAAGALQTFGVNLAQLNNPLTLAATAIKSSIDYTTQWADTIDQLARVTGQGARETSILTTVLGDFGIGAQTVQQAAKALKNEGLAPTIGTLKDLARQYQALPEGAARTEWGTKKLGKAYFDLSEVLSKTPAEFDQLTAAAERSGKVMDEQGVEAAQKFKLQLAQLQDQVDGLKVALGMPLITTTSKAMTAFDQLVKIWQIGKIRLDEQNGKIDHNTAVLRQMEAAGLSTAQASAQLEINLGKVTDASDRNAASVAAAQQHASDLAHSYIGLGDSEDRAASVADRHNAATIGATNAQNAAKVAADLLRASFGDLTKEVMFNQMASSLDAQGQLELARQLGLVNENTYAGLTAAAELKDKYDKNHDGVVSAAEGAKQYAAELAALQAQMNGFQDKTVTLTLVTQGDIGQVRVAQGGGAQKTTARAMGGRVTAGDPTLAGESVFTRPEVFVPSQNGYMLTKQDAMAALGGAAGPTFGAGAIVVNAAAGQSAEAVAQAVMVAIAAKTRALRSGGAAYMGA